MCGIQFKSVGDSGLNISDIVVKDVDGNTGDGATMLWTWNGTTYNGKVKYWTTRYADAAHTIPVEGAGWGDTERVATNIVFNVGDSVWIQSSVGSFSKKSTFVTIAGEVVNPGSDVGYYTWEINRNKKTMISSPFPMSEVALNDILVFKDSDPIVVGDGATMAWGWNGTTYNQKFKYWTTRYADKEHTIPVSGAGWGDLERVATNVVFAAGEGIWIQSSVGGFSDKKLKIRVANPFFVE